MLYIVCICFIIVVTCRKPFKILIPQFYGYVELSFTYTQKQCT